MKPHWARQHEDVARSCESTYTIKYWIGVYRVLYLEAYFPVLEPHRTVLVERLQKHTELHADGLFINSRCRPEFEMAGERNDHDLQIESS